MARDYDALLRFIAERAAMPFDWASTGNNCASYAGGAVAAQTGRNPLGGLHWKTARGAAGVLRRLGGMEAALGRRLRPIAPAQAARGDVAGVPDQLLGLRLMIVEGATLVGPGEHGAKRMPRSAMAHAWSAGGE